MNVWPVTGSAGGWECYLVRGRPPLIGEDNVAIMRELVYNQQAVDAVMKHTKAKLLEAAGGRERLAKALTGHIPEYWDEGHDK
eukprot:COSAG05_NODE_1385_length_5011_cov_12.476995_4_plen_83_part_00